MNDKKGEKERNKILETKEFDKTQIEELEILKMKMTLLKSKLKKQKKSNFKQFNKRNFKVIKSACNFAVPFVVTAGLTVGIFKALGGGFPFNLDNVTKYKLYSMDYLTDNSINIEEEYKKYELIGDPLPSSNLIMYTPWKLQGKQYVRTKREYDLGKLKTLELFETILNNDYDYIFNNLDNYREENQIANEIDESVENKYRVEANLYMMDKDDILQYKESTLKNLIITIVEMVLILGVGGFSAHIREFDFSSSLKKINRTYHYAISLTESTDLIKEKIKSTEEKILSLTKKKEGGNDE